MEEPVFEEVGFADGFSVFGAEEAGALDFGASDFGAAELGLLEGDFEAFALALELALAFALALAFELGLLVLEEFDFVLDFAVDVALDDGDESSLFTTGALLLLSSSLSLLFAFCTSSASDLSSSKSGASLW